MAGKTKRYEDVVELGFSTEHPGIDSLPFRAAQTLLDYDVVLWDPGWMLSAYETDYSGDYQGRALLDANDSALVREDVARRKREFVELLKLGGVVVVFVSVPDVVYCHTGEKEHSGTGRNRQTTNIVTAFSFAQAHPLAIDLVAAQGSQMEFRGTEPFGAFWRAHKDAFQYRAYFETKIGTPQVFIRRTDRPVAATVQAEKGWLIYLPDLVSDVPDGDEKNAAAREIAALEGIMELVAALRQGSGDFSLPEWAKRYRLAGEEEALAALTKAGTSVERAQQRQDTARRALAALEERKLLFTGTGPALEAQVARAFESLGFDVKPGETGRADLILTHGARSAVVEVKGVSKSAKESNAAQLEKWVSGFIEAEGKQPKAILVVNAFAEKDLEDRDSQAFPDQMLDYCQARGHCLITGGQLLMAALEVEANGDIADEVVDSILHCVGVYDRHTDWVEALKPEHEGAIDVAD